MKKVLCLMVLSLGFGAVVMANDACNPCPPPPCPPPMKWVTVCETVQVEVPVKTWVYDDVEVECTVMKPVEKEVQYTVNKCVMENKTVMVKKKVMRDEEYTKMVKKTIMQPKTMTRKVAKIVCEEVTKEVDKVYWDEVCDPATGKITKCKRVEKECVPVTVKKKIWVDEEYTVNCPVVIEEPVKCIRKVPCYVEEEKCIQVPKTVCETKTKKVIVMEPAKEKKIVKQKRCVTTTKTIEKVVQKKVQVPCEPPAPVCPPPACKPAC